MKTYCAHCDKETTHKKDKLHHVLHVGNTIIEGDVFGYICQVCHTDGIITDSRELDKKYVDCFRTYNSNMLTGAQIKEIRQNRKLSVPKFVAMLNENGIAYSEDEYKEIEGDTLAQSGAMENFLRAIGGYPKWEGYKE